MTSHSIEPPARAGADGPAPSRPQLQAMLAALRLDVTYERAGGDHLTYRDPDGVDVEVLDMVGGFGSLLLGHAHPAIVAEAQRLLAAQRPLYVQGANRPYAQRLAAALSDRAGGDYAVVFGNSGAEGVEAALKHAMLATGRKTFIAVEGAFHGKTLGALQLTHNPFYGEAFALSGMRVLHVPPDDLDALAQAFEAAGGNVAAFVFEPVLGEGGVRPLSRAFIQRAAVLCRKHGAALVADECQTGLGRTGRFLASQTLGVQPDTIVLSKALGGGLAKISACLFRRTSYHHGFDLRHTSTFADDDYSAAIALKTLELIDDDLLASVQRKGASLLARLSDLRRAWPDVIREVRGVGLMLGIEFRVFSKQSDGFLLRLLSSQEELVKLLTGFFLHEHRVRVMPLLSDPFTLRVQPSALLDDADAERFVRALADVCAKLRANDCVGLTQFLCRPDTGAPCRAPALPSEAGGFLAYRTGRDWQRKEEAPRKRVAWICHMVDSEDLVTLEPAFALLPASEREAILRRAAASAPPVLMSSVDVRSQVGESARLECIMLPFTSSWVKACMDAGDVRLARALVQRSVDLARDLGCSVAALGQYTSIVTANGRRVDSGDMGLTSGNSYAVALAVESVQRAIHARRLDAKDATLAVVGAAGNIGRTCATILAPWFGRTLLVGRGAPGAAGRLRKLAKQLPRDGVQLVDGLDALAAADVVVSAPNTARAILHSGHLQPEAIVCDLSVPASVDPKTAQERPDVLLIKGGVARLPFDDDLELPGFPLPRGQAYACMAEAVLLGLEGIGGRSFTGALRPDRVLRIGRLARRHGFELAEYKTGCVFGSDERQSEEGELGTQRYRAAN